MNYVQDIKLKFITPLTSTARIFCIVDCQRKFMYALPVKS